MSSLVNQIAPDFTVSDQSGQEHTLSNYKGQKVLLYFYPKDDTPGCTIQAQCVRDRLGELEAKGIKVFGVSCDDESSHQKFIKKYDLNFTLLSDMNKKIVQEYGVWVEKNMYGKKSMGIQRDAFLIDENGVLIKHYKKVKPAQFVDLVLADL